MIADLRNTMIKSEQSTDRGREGRYGIASFGLASNFKHRNQGSSGYVDDNGSMVHEISGLQEEGV